MLCMHNEISIALHSIIQMKLYNIAQCKKSRLMVLSCEAKKKQHARVSSGQRYQYGELFTQMAALKFENAVTQPL